MLLFHPSLRNTKMLLLALSGFFSLGLTLYLATHHHRIYLFHFFNSLIQCSGSSRSLLSLSRSLLSLPSLCIMTRGFLSAVYLCQQCSHSYRWSIGHKPLQTKTTRSLPECLLYQCMFFVRMPSLSLICSCFSSPFPDLSNYYPYLRVSFTL